MAVIQNTTITTDIAPEISIDLASRLVSNIDKLREVLGVTEMRAVPEGATLKRYTTSIANLAAQVAEGEEINLTKVTRTAADPISVVLKKYRKLVTAEAIQRSGSDVAINETDDKLVSEIRKAIKKDFFDGIEAGTGTATNGNGLQAALANVWGAAHSYFEDIDASPVFFVNPVDVAKYLGTATVTTQEAFGFTYLENFLGLGTAILSAEVDAGTVIGTAKENLNCAYVPANGDVGAALGLTADASGLIGVRHTADTSRASLETLAISGVVFYAEDLAGVFKANTTVGA